ncbi:MAG: tRNA pseudouridine(13) synthase TruD [Haliangiales bacterium]
MQARLFDLPYLTADLPGTGGILRTQDADFRVEEIPAYEPSGAGEHVFVLIEKRGLTTPAAAERLARAVDVSTRDVGWAGMKDRHAITRQWLSLPPPVSAAAVRALEGLGADTSGEPPGGDSNADAELRVLDVANHPHKLRTGHLSGNRFVITVRQTEVDAEVAAERARAILAALADGPGSPNWFGPQRFGRDGQNPALGRQLIADPAATGDRRRGPRGRQKRLFISALQSALFNEHLRRRLDDGLFAQVIAGDVLQKTQSGGIFGSDEPDVDQVRMDAGEVVPTGPMFGHKMRRPAEGSPAHEREQAILRDAELELSQFARVGKLGVGTRRPLAVNIGATAVTAVGEHAIELSFSLPAGSYATALLREVVKGSTPFPG